MLKTLETEMKNVRKRSMKSRVSLYTSLTTNNMGYNLIISQTRNKYKPKTARR